MNYRSVFLATTILISEKSSTNQTIARHLDEKSRDCKQIIYIAAASVNALYWISSMQVPPRTDVRKSYDYSAVADRRIQLTEKHGGQTLASIRPEMSTFESKREH
jgi:hypothetical protein